MATKARIAANIRYNKSRDSITIRPDKETGSKIRAAAAAAGMPIQRYLVNAALEKMARDAATDQQEQDHDPTIEQ